MRRFAAAALYVALTGCQTGDSVPVAAANIDVVAPIPGANVAVAYLDISNRSGDPIAITRVTSPQFESVAMHETTIADGISSMRPVDSVVIGDGETLRFEPGGLHLMLMRPIPGGDQVTLNFYSNGTLLLSVSAGMRSHSD